MTGSHGRKLFGAPMLLQDWGQEAQHAFQYWELFLDLLLVAAASAVTDQFKENLSWIGFGEFVVFSLSLVSSWLLYTHHITTRFQDASFVHSMVLFVYLVGFGLCNVNTGYDTVQDFCWGAVLLRVSILVMLGSFSMCLERARYFSTALGCLTITSTVSYLVVALFGHDIKEKPVIMAIFWLAVFVEVLGEVMMASMLESRKMVPVNIDHSKERLGALELCALGETILSVTLIYREMTGEASEEEAEEGGKEEKGNHTNTSLSFFWVLVYSFLLVFMFLLLFFHLQPEPDDHALRRSKFHGVSLVLVYKILAVAFLAVGVSAKLVVESCLEQEEMPPAASQLMGYAVGAACLLLLVMRYLHYGGRESVNFGHLQMRPGEDSQIDRVAMTWWGTYGAAGLVPIAGVLTGWTQELDPLHLTGFHALFVFLLCLLETYYFHKIQEMLEKKDGGGEHQVLAASADGRTYS
jgi:low temperature requirement protein LtrA